MGRTNTKRWSHSTGERGRNRVRVFEHSSGILMLETRIGGKRERSSLGHRDKDRAKREADLAAAKLAMAKDGRTSTWSRSSSAGVPRRRRRATST